MLTVAPALRETIGLDKVPHWTTLQKFMAKPEVLLIIDSMIGEVLKETKVVVSDSNVAVDSTSLQNSNASIH